MRTIDQIFEHFKEIDSETALTKTAIRRLVTTGTIPSVRISAKYLIAVGAVENYLCNAGKASYFFAGVLAIRITTVSDWMPTWEGSEWRNQNGLRGGRCSANIFLPVPDWNHKTASQCGEKSKGVFDDGRTKIQSF